MAELMPHDAIMRFVLLAIFFSSCVVCSLCVHSLPTYCLVVYYFYQLFFFYFGSRDFDMDLLPNSKLLDLCHKLVTGNTMTQYQVCLLHCMRSVYFRLRKKKQRLKQCVCGVDDKQAARTARCEQRDRALEAGRQADRHDAADQVAQRVRSPLADVGRMRLVSEEGGRQ